MFCGDICTIGFVILNSKLLLSTVQWDRYVVSNRIRIWKTPNITNKLNLELLFIGYLVCIYYLLLFLLLQQVGHTYVYHEITINMHKAFFSYIPFFEHYSSFREMLHYCMIRVNNNNKSIILLLFRTGETDTFCIIKCLLKMNSWLWTLHTLVFPFLPI